MVVAPRERPRLRWAHAGVQSLMEVGGTANLPYCPAAGAECAAHLPPRPSSSSSAGKQPSFGGRGVNISDVLKLLRAVDAR